MQNPQQRSVLEDRALRTTYITRLFLVLGIEGDEQRVAGWVESTLDLTVEQVDLGCRRLMRETSKGYPRPAHLLEAAARGRRIVSGEPDRPAMPEEEREAWYRRIGMPFLHDMHPEAVAIRERQAKARAEREARR